MFDHRGHVVAALLAFSLLLALLLSGPAQAQDRQSQYQTTIAEAVREFSEGHWAEARALFKQAHGLSPNARTLRGSGMAAYEMRLYVAAMRELEAALRDDRKALTPAQRDQVQGLITDARRFVGRYKFVIEPPEARAIIDGSPAKFEPGNVLFLNVGTHTIGASAAGYKLASRRLQVEGGEDKEIQFILEAVGGTAPIDVTKPPEEPAQAEPEPAPEEPAPAARSSDSAGLMTTMGYVALIGGAASGIAAAGFWFAGESKFDDLEASCGPNCSDREISNSGVESADTLTTVFLASAGVWGTLGVLLLVFADDGEAPDASASRVSPAPSTALSLSPAGVELRGRF